MANKITDERLQVIATKPKVSASDLPSLAEAVDMAVELLKLRKVLKFSAELCSAVDLAEEDIGGSRSVREILADLGPAVDAASQS